jgi:hypothetical protein
LAPTVLLRRREATVECASARARLTVRQALDGGGFAAPGRARGRREAREATATPAGALLARSVERQPRGTRLRVHEVAERHRVRLVQQTRVAAASGSQKPASQGDAVSLVQPNARERRRGAQQRAQRSRAERLTRRHSVRSASQAGAGGPTSALCALRRALCLRGRACARRAPAEPARARLAARRRPAPAENMDGPSGGLKLPARVNLTGLGMFGGNGSGGSGGGTPSSGAFGAFGDDNGARKRPC